MRGVVASNGTLVVYHAILKSMHSETLLRLDKTTDWLSSFNVSGSCLEQERPDALLMHIEALPHRFTVVREPMSHLFSGMAQVESYWHHPGPAGMESLRTDTRWKTSRWRQCWTTANPSNPPMRFHSPALCTPVERATAMLKDMLDQSGPRAYLIILTHALPQTIGLLSPQMHWTIPLVMHSEKDADEWPVLVRTLSLGISPIARGHANVRTRKHDASKFEFNQSNMLQKPQRAAPSNLRDAPTRVRMPWVWHISVFGMAEGMKKRRVFLRPQQHLAEGGQCPPQRGAAAYTTHPCRFPC